MVGQVVLTVQEIGQQAAQAVPVALTVAAVVVSLMIVKPPPEEMVGLALFA